MSDVRWTWNRYARPIPRPPGSVEEERRYRERGDQNPERTPLSAETEGALEHLSRYLLARPRVPGLRVVDGGAGHGYGTLLLAASGALLALGIDRDSAAVAPALALAASSSRSPGNSNAQFLSADLESIPLRAETCDLLVAFEVFEHLERPERFLEESKRLLAPGGWLLLSTPNRDLVSPGWHLPPNRFHVREYDPEEWRRFLREHFSRLEMRGQIPGPALLARRHQGRSGRRLAVWAERRLGFDPRRLLPTRTRRSLRRLLNERVRPDRIAGASDSVISVPSSSGPSVPASGPPSSNGPASQVPARHRPVSQVPVLHGSPPAGPASPGPASPGSASDDPKFHDLEDRMREWIARGLSASGPELDGLYRYGAPDEGEQLVAACQVHPVGEGFFR